MKINVGDYQITSDNLQFIVSRKNIIKEGVFTKEENIGKETWKPIAYCTKFDEALRFIPQDILRSNDDVSEIRRQLDEIHDAVLCIKEYPVIVVKAEKEEKEIEENE